MADSVTHSSKGQHTSKTFIGSVKGSTFFLLCRVKSIATRMGRALKHAPPCVGLPVSNGMSVGAMRAVVAWRDGGDALFRKCVENTLR